MITSYKTNIYSHEHGFTFLCYDGIELVRFNDSTIILTVPKRKSKVLLKRINQFSEQYNLNFFLRSVCCGSVNKWLLVANHKVTDLDIVGELKIERNFCYDK